MTSATGRHSKQVFSNTTFIRSLGWANLAVMFVFLGNNFATFWGGFPGPALNGNAAAMLQAFAYPAAVGLAIFLVISSSERGLRDDSKKISDMNAFFIRAAFWIVLIVGIVDMVISFLRVEEYLTIIVGEDLASSLGRAHFRGPYVHVPLMVLGVIIASFTRTLGFHWLTLLIVVAELLIVFLRFIFSYEQAFMSDLVRFWYGALFLFASAYTLLEEGHVRVDILYAGFRKQTKGWVNSIGTLFMGILLCWTILVLGMGKQTSIINSPILNFETTQQGFGLYVKYMMAAFLGIFAISMMIQFVSYLMASVADYRGEEGGYEPNRLEAH